MCQVPEEVAHHKSNLKGDRAITKGFSRYIKDVTGKLIQIGSGTIIMIKRQYVRVPIYCTPRNTVVSIRTFILLKNNMRTTPNTQCITWFQDNTNDHDLFSLQEYVEFAEWHFAKQLILKK